MSGLESAAVTLYSKQGYYGKESTVYAKASDGT